MIRILFFLTLNIKVFIVLSQPITVTGTVHDEKAGDFIPYANVTLPRAYIGTVSNEAGQFKLTIPDKFKGDTLVISALGYSTHYIVVTRNIVDINIKLKPKVYEISEVYVLPKGLTATNILEKAVRNFRKHLEEYGYMQTFFYRELITTGNKYSFLMEAAGEVHFPRFSFSDNKIRIKLDQLRRSNFYGNTQDNWLRKMIYKKFFGATDNGISFFWETYQTIVNRIQNYNFDEVEKIDNINSFTLKGITYIDSIKVYEIFCSNEYINSTYYVRSDNFQFVKIVKGFKVPELASETIRGFIDGCYIEKYEFNFQSFGKKIVFSHGWYKALPHSSTFKKIKENEIQMEEIQIVSNQTFFSGYRRISGKEILGKDENIYKKEMNYNPVFWSNYNAIILNPLLKQQQSDLEKEINLEQQFYQNQKGIEL